MEDDGDDDDDGGGTAMMASAHRTQPNWMFATLLQRAKRWL